MYLMAKRPVLRRDTQASRKKGRRVLLAANSPAYPILLQPPLLLSRHVLLGPAEGERGVDCRGTCEFVCILIQQILNCVHTMWQRPR